MAGIPSASGSRARQGFVPTETVGPIERLEAAGAVIFARTAVPEFCYFGVTESRVQRAHRQPVEPGTHLRRLVRRRRCRRGGRRRAAVARWRRRRLDPHPRRVLWRRRVQAHVRPGSARAVHSRLEDAGRNGAVGSVGRRRAAHADHRRRLRSPRSAQPPVDRARRPTARAAATPRSRIRGSRISPRSTTTCAGRSGPRLQRLSAAGVDVITDNPRLGSSVAIWSAIAVAEARVSEADELAGHRAELGEAALAFILAGEQISTMRVHPGAVRPGTHPPGLRRSVRTDRRSRAAHPDTGLRGLPARKPAPGRTSAGSRSSYPDLDWGPFLYDANLAGMPACALPMGLGDDGLPVSLQVTGPRCSRRAGARRRRDDRASDRFRRPAAGTSRLRTEPAAATVSGAAGASCRCARSGTIPAGAALHACSPSPGRLGASGTCATVRLAARRRTPRGRRSACTCRSCSDAGNGWPPRSVTATSWRRASSSQLDPPALVQSCSTAVLVGRRARAGTQLRLRPGPVRRRGAGHLAHRPSGDRDVRPAVGTVRRGERRRPGGRLHLRRPARGRVTASASRCAALPTGDLRHGAAGPGRAGPDPGSCRLQRGAARPQRRARHRVPAARA